MAANTFFIERKKPNKKIRVSFQAMVGRLGFFASISFGVSKTLQNISILKWSGTENCTNCEAFVDFHDPRYWPSTRPYSENDQIFVYLPFAHCIGHIALSPLCIPSSRRCRSKSITEWLYFPWNYCQDKPKERSRVWADWWVIFRETMKIKDTHGYTCLRRFSGHIGSQTKTGSGLFVLNLCGFSFKSIQKLVPNRQHVDKNGQKAVAVSFLTFYSAYLKKNLPKGCDIRGV